LRVAEASDCVYLGSKMIISSSRFISFIYRYWRTVAASAE